jgi:hypothetical protein
VSGDLTGAAAVDRFVARHGYDPQDRRDTLPDPAHESRARAEEELTERVARAIRRAYVDHGRRYGAPDNEAALLACYRHVAAAALTAAGPVAADS